jgi:tellurite resistance protein TehA-like permease
MEARRVAGAAIPAFTAAQGGEETMRWSVAKFAENLGPEAFSGVMATGIVSMATAAVGWIWISAVLFGAAGLQWLALAAAYGWRAAFLRPVRRGGLFRYFAVPASCAVLGARSDLAGWHVVGASWFLLAVVSWAVLSYAVALALVTGTWTTTGPPDGTWLLGAVAPEALSVNAALLWPALRHTPILMLLGLVWWGLGLMLYGVLVTAVLRRLLFGRLDPDELAPPYWIIMGAAALGALGGSLWIEAAQGYGLLGSLTGPLTLVCTLLWGWATWWIPLLVGLGWWRHVVRRRPIRYGSAWWSLVFPLGMYAVSTFHLEQVTRAPALSVGAESVAVTALATWVAVAAGAAIAGLRSLKAPRGFGGLPPRASGDS